MSPFHRLSFLAVILSLGLAVSAADARQATRKIQTDPGGAPSQLGKPAPQQLDALAFQQQIASMQRQIEADTQAIAALQAQVKSQSSDIAVLQHPVPGNRMLVNQASFGHLQGNYLIVVYEQQ
jgi:TolA-binding protein